MLKQHLRHAWVFEPNVWEKLTLWHLFKVLKQNLRHAWVLGPYAREKLTLWHLFKVLKQNLRHVWVLGLDVWEKLTLWHLFKVLKQNVRHAWVLEPDTWGKLTLWHLYERNLSTRWSPQITCFRFNILKWLHSSHYREHGYFPNYFYIVNLFKLAAMCYCRFW